MRGLVSTRRMTVWVLLLSATLANVLPARAGLNSAANNYAKGDYTRAFQEFSALARLGQPVAQYDLAYMYASGQGTGQSDLDAYAWAMLASENGAPHGQALADKLLPKLALQPGWRGKADEITAAYTPAVLNRTLLPDFGKTGSAPAAGGPPDLEGRHVFGTSPNPGCQPTKMSLDNYPLQPSIGGLQDSFLVQYTVFPDGTARMPRVTFGLTAPQFDGAARTMILTARFAPLPAGSQPVRCTLHFQFIEPDLHADDYPPLERYLRQLRHDSEQGDPRSEAMYGTALADMPQIPKAQRTLFLWWLVKAAQAGNPLAQYEVGASLEAGYGGCLRDDAKALRWLRLAALQNEAHAEVSLAIRLLRGSPDAMRVAAARDWLERAVLQGNAVGEMYLSALLAASPDATLRDPGRALRLERKAFEYVTVDPTADEIRAAAYAAEGTFADAVSSERDAIRKARALGWTLPPLEKRLALYQAGKLWYGSLLSYESLYSTNGSDVSPDSVP